MAETIKEKVSDVGHKIVEGAEKAADWVKDKTGLAGSVKSTNPLAANVRERMDVIASCGKKIGVVDHLDGDSIKLTRKDSPDNQHHFIPMNWVERVDSHVHLATNSEETERSWKSAA